MNEPHAQLVESLPWNEKWENIEEDDRLAAFGLYSAALCFCQRNLTDGRIRRSELARVFPSAHVPRITDLLVSAHWFDTDGNGSFLVHDYLQHNRSREEIEQLRAQKRAAGARGGQASAKARAQAPAKPRADGLLQAESNPDTNTNALTHTQETPNARGDFAQVSGRMERATGSLLSSTDITAVTSWCRQYETAYILAWIGDCENKGKASTAYIGTVLTNNAGKMPRGGNGGGYDNEKPPQWGESVF